MVLRSDCPEVYPRAGDWSSRHTGTDPGQWASDPEVAAEHREYAYDPIGNRRWQDENSPAVRTMYDSNDLNQYSAWPSTAIRRPACSRPNDEDGNLSRLDVAGDLNCDGRVLVRLREFPGQSGGRIADRIVA